MGMELCEGGSLYSMLDQPKFSYGLPEDEFLVVLFDIGKIIMMGFDLIFKITENLIFIASPC